MSPRARKNTRRRRKRRLGFTSWVLLVLLVLAGLSLVAGPWFRARTVSGRPVPQVQVLNGSSVRGMAGRVAELLRDRGLDVVSVGNADSNTYEQTLVLLRRGDMTTAHRVTQALGAGDALEQLDPTLLVDVTIILGADFPPPDAGTAPTEDGRASR